MEHELVGLAGPGGRWRPVAAGPFTLLAVVLALAPIRPVWLWAVLIGAVAAVPWALGAVPEARLRRPRPYWRLSAAGLERIGPGGLTMVSYERSRIDALAITTGDGVLTVFHRFGRTAAGGMTAMGLEPLAVFVTARRLGIPMHVLDGEATDLLDPALDEALRIPGLDDDVPGGSALPRDHAAEKRLLDQEAALLAAAHEPSPQASPEPPEEPSTEGGARPARRRRRAGGRGRDREQRLDTPEPLPSRRRIVLLGALTALLGTVMIVRIALDGTSEFGARLAAGCWVLAAIAGMLAARRRLLRAVQVRWTITAERLLVRARPGRRREAQNLPAGDVAAVVVGPGLRLDPVSGEPRRAELAALAFGHRLELVARLPAHGLDGFQLAHALDDHGYRVITPGARAPRSPDYGLEGLPEIFAQVPGGRLVVADGGLGWADAAGDVVLKMPEDRIGGIELLTIAGHAWVRLYDTDGDEFFAAPLSALRISRTDLRDSARRAGLPVNDAEYDAYLSAAFHSAVSTLTVPEPETGKEPEPATAALPSPSAGQEGGTALQPDLSGEQEFTFTVSAPPGPATAPGALLDATRRSRIGTYGMSVLLCQAVALLGAVWLGPELGGFNATASWSVPAGLVIGLVGYWLYDRNRSQLRVSSAGLAVVTKRGRVEWDLTRDRIGGIGIDEARERMPRLVVWGPSGRVLRQVTFPPDLDELRRACERYGVPWGPPDADRPAPPPPEL
ncbi:hypothetical protein [Actinomadura sp. 7K507]|uniref:hypothetical protein n=1 Tax=Actinomadura sp. 7K507 TaxID=2530365 RepID=UPI001053F592|nr:hypothetical protein [Actinomadura sp. 7K507]TDC85476.1 hypothetical protein E1285_25155 [Actinomadura sp. 7K507]